MSSNQTQNYGLHQWEPGDSFLREEFNENFGAIDGAMAGAVVFGTYTGDGNSSRNINLGRRPKAVILAPNNGFWGNGSSVRSGLFGGNLTLSGYAQITDAGFTVSYSSNGVLNNNGTIYYYAAFF